MGRKRLEVYAAFKQEVLQYIEDKHCTVYEVYKHVTNKVKGMDYSVGMYYQRCKKKKEMMSLSKTKKRCSGAGRPPALAELENILFDKIVEMRIRKIKVSRSNLCGCAQQLAIESFQGFINMVQLVHEKG